MSLSSYFQANVVRINDLIKNCNSILNNNQIKKQDVADKYSIEPITRLRKNEDEIISAEKNSTDLQFIIDSLTDIFKT